MTLRQRLTLILAIAARPQSELAICFGYRGAPRIAALLGSRLFQSPVIVRSDTNQANIEQGPRLRRYLRRTFLRLLIPKSASAWTIGTENERFWRQEAGLTRTVRIPYEVSVLPGLKTTGSISERHSDPKKMRFLAVGRLIKLKRFDDLIAAFRRLDGAEYRCWSLSIVGSGPEESALKRLASGDSRIRFVGAVGYAELGDHFSAADVLVAPSSRENWGLVINEALGFGLYVIASNSVGASIDLITKENGTVFPRGDQDALTHALKQASDFTIRLPRVVATDTATLMMEAINATR